MKLKEVLLGEEELTFLGEVLCRTTLMFCIILLALRLLGKKGVKQLSVFELVVIIGLGSAAGDPMFYKEVGILAALTVFAAVIMLYKLASYLIFKYKFFENLMEGQPICLIEMGKFKINNFKKESLSQDEFFAELRLNGVSQLGQVELAVLEISGDVSVFFYSNENTQYRLPILPHALDHPIQEITHDNWYACIFCGNTLKIQPIPKKKCPTCHKSKWVEASDKKRVE